MKKENINIIDSKDIDNMKLDNEKIVNSEIERIGKKQTAGEALTPTEKALLFTVTEQQESAQKLKETNPVETKLDTTVDANLNNENQTRFDVMPERKKGLLGRIYEGLYKIPGVNKIVGKLEIAYNNIHINGLTNKERKLQEEIDEIDKEIKLSEKSREIVQSFIIDAKSKGAPVTALEKDMFSTARRIEDLSREKADLQEESQEQREKRDLYINKRNEVADKLINYYDEKIKPMEKELDNLQGLKSQLDLRFIATEITHKKQKTDLRDIEEKMAHIMQSWSEEGRSEGAIKKTLKDLERYLARGKESIEKEENKLFDEQAEIENDVAEANRLVALYKEKRDEFVRIKENRPIEVKKDIKADQSLKGVPLTESIFADKAKERLSAESYIARWNEYLQSGNNTESLKTTIDLKDFLETTKWSNNFVLDFEDFKKIIPAYYRSKGTLVNNDMLNNTLDKFYKEKV